MQKKKLITKQQMATLVLFILLILTNIGWFMYSQSQDTVNTYTTDALSDHETRIRELEANR